MMLPSLLFLAICSSAVLGSPTALLAVEQYKAGSAIPGHYIVTLKAGTDRSAVAAKVGAAAVKAQWDILHGFAGKFDQQTLNTLRANTDVESIHEDGVVHMFDIFRGGAQMITQTNAPWGLSRISQDAALTKTAAVSSLNYTYTYDSRAGAGVDIYIVDTGILTTHSQFGGRAKWGATFGGYADRDGNGHGTHCAGTAAGSQFGVAKAANLIAVKVLSDGGSGAWSDMISGLDFIKKAAAASGRPSVASLSLGGGVYPPADAAVEALVAAGVSISIAAGNSNADAANTSPARVPSALTVGASTIADARAYFSNFGAVVDVFAPGMSVISSWIGSDTATASISGTSMAAPHITGLVAYLLSEHHGQLSPAEVAELIQSLAVKDALTSIPGGTVNYLASNGAQSASEER